MQERLIHKDLYNISIPGETKTKQFIGLQLQKEKYHEKKKKTGEKTDNVGRKPGPKKVWRGLLEPFAIAQHTTKNAVIFDEFIKSLGPVDDWPNDIPHGGDKNDTADRKK